MLVTACCTATSAWCIAACSVPSMEREFEPVCENPQVPLPPPASGRAEEQEPRLWRAGLSNLRQPSDGYLAGAFDWSVFDAADLAAFLLCFLCWLLAGAAGCSAAGAVAGASAATTRPASRARATTGTSFVNIDLVSRARK